MRGPAKTWGCLLHRSGRADAFPELVANFYILKTKKITAGSMALGDWLGCYRVGILADMGSGNCLVWIQRLMATVAMGLGQFQRFLSCDPDTGLHKTHCNSYTCFYIFKVFFPCSVLPPQKGFLFEFGFLLSEYDMPM